MTEQVNLKVAHYAEVKHFSVNINHKTKFVEFSEPITESMAQRLFFDGMTEEKFDSLPVDIYIDLSENEDYQDYLLAKYESEQDAKIAAHERSLDAQIEERNEAYSRGDH